MDEELIGKRVRCSACQSILVVSSPPPDQKPTLQARNAAQPSQEDAAKQLFAAVEMGDATNLAALLQSGLTANVRDKGGNTLLHKAALKKSQECCAALVAHGADPSVRNADNETPLETMLDFEFRMSKALEATLGSFGATASRLKDQDLFRLVCLFKDNGSPRPKQMDERTWNSHVSRPEPFAQPSEAGASLGKHRLLLAGGLVTFLVGICWPLLYYQFSYLPARNAYLEARAVKKPLVEEKQKAFSAAARQAEEHRRKHGFVPDNLRENQENARKESAQAGDQWYRAPERLAYLPTVTRLQEGVQFGFPVAGLGFLMAVAGLFPLARGTFVILCSAIGSGIGATTWVVHETVYFTYPAVYGDLKINHTRTAVFASVGLVTGGFLGFLIFGLKRLLVAGRNRAARTEAMPTSASATAAAANKGHCPKCAATDINTESNNNLLFKLMAFGVGGGVIAPAIYFLLWKSFWGSVLIGGILGFVVAGLVFGNYCHSCGSCGHRWKTS